MPRIKTRWLVAWFDSNGKFRDSIIRELCGAPRKWAERRCNEGETCDYWNVSSPGEEQRVLASLEQSKRDTSQ